MMEKFEFLCVDFQFDFVSPNGKSPVHGSSVAFITQLLIPFFQKNRIRVHEIISDYRLPRGKSKNESCVPGTKGFESMLPAHLVIGERWIKCMHNPLWTRKNIGQENLPLGKEYQSPKKFNLWLNNQNLKGKKVVLFGETADCCLLNVAMELYFRGCDVFFLYEATDMMDERQQFKEFLLQQSSIAIYTKTICFDDLIKEGGYV